MGNPRYRAQSREEIEAAETIAVDRRSRSARLLAALREQLPRAVRKALKKHKTRSAVADVVGVDRRTIQAWERGEVGPHGPALTNAAELCQEIGQGLDWLVDAEAEGSLADRQRADLVAQLESDPAIRSQALPALPDADQLRNDVIRAYATALKTLDEQEVRAARQALARALLTHWNSHGQELSLERQNQLFRMISALQTAAPSEPVGETLWHQAGSLADWAGPIYETFRIRPGNSAEHEHSPERIAAMREQLTPNYARTE